VAFVQNGIPWWYGHGLSAARPPAPDLSRLDPGGALARAVGLERTIGAVVTSSNHVIEPGVVRNISPDRNTLWVGETDDRQSPRIAALRATLQQLIDEPARRSRLGAAGPLRARSLTDPATQIGTLERVLTLQPDALLAHS